MSFFSDLFHGDFSNLGNDITHAPSSLINHPDELAETLGGALAIGTGGLGLAGLGPLGGALGGVGDSLGGGLTGLFGGGEAAADAGAAGAAADPLAFTGATTDAFGNSAAGGAINTALGAGGGVPLPTASPFALGDVGLPSDIGGYLGGAGDITGSTGGVTSLGGQAAGQVAASAGTGPTGFDIANPSTWGSSAWNAVSSNPLKTLGVLGGAGALGYDILQGRKPLADQNALQGQATQLSAQGQQFMSYLQAGTLPAGLQSLVDKQTQAAKAMAIANAAKNGQSTDPTTNTQLADAINSAQQQATMQVAQLG